MSDNRTFFKNAQQGCMSLKDIFSDVMRVHTPEESARVFIAGTALTTPDESEMLAGWQKPFLFARFFGIFLLCLALSMGLSHMSPGGTDALLVGTVVIVPMTMLLLAWEMNVPRTISLMEVLKIVAVGGLLSLIFTLLLIMFGIDFEDAAWAPMVEEPGKLLVIWLLLKKKNYKYTLEGVLLGMAVGTGFAIVETLNYVLNSMRQSMILAMAELIVGWASSNGADYAINQMIDVVINQMGALRQVLMEDGAAAGMNTAILRSFNGIVGHGVYAALYGGGLLLAKGAEPVSFRHLMKMDFIRYFAAAFLIHFLNNSWVADLFPELIPGKLLSWSFVKVTLGAVFLLPLLKIGVNQVVEATIAYHGGHVTRAVSQEEAAQYEKNPKAAYAPAAALEFLAGPLTGKQIPLYERQECVIGRHPNCKVSVNLASVSSVHCSVTLSGNMVLVTDMGSTNGTYVGSQRLNPRQQTIVPDGSVVYIGNQNCGFRVRIR